MTREGSNRSKKMKPQSGSSVLPFFSGLAIGLFVALIVYLNKHNTTLSYPGNPSTQQQARAAPATVETPKFDFYTILPEQEVKVPEWTPPESSEPPPLDEKTILQVGSFQQFEDADRVKAELALLGMSATIQKVVIKGQNVWYRVRLGPFAQPEQLEAARKKLIDNNMDFMLLRDDRNASKG